MLRFFSPDFRNQLISNSQMSGRIQPGKRYGAVLFLMTIGMLVVLSVEAQAASLNSVQSGTATIDSNVGTNTLTVNISAIDTSKTFLSNDHSSIRKMILLK